MKAHSDKWLQACVSMMGKKLNETQAAIADWWFESPSRFCLLLGGERAGKSWLASFLFLACVNIDKRGEYWFVGPDYNQARPEFTYVYEALRDGLGGISFVVPDSVSMPVNTASPWSFTTIWGQVFRTKSAADIQKLASFSVSGIIMCEAAQQVFESYLKLFGRVSETGGCLILSGTLEQGLPWYADLFNRWQGANELLARSFSIPSWSNTDIYPGGLEHPRMKELMATFPPDLFQERFGAQPMRKHGLVLPEYDVKVHVKHLEHNPKLPVELAIDPGQHCYAVLFVQSDGLITNVLDRVYVRNKIVQDIIPEVMGRPLFKFINLSDGGVIDNAGKQRQANKSQVELWQEIAGLSLRSNYVWQNDNIAALRLRLGVGNPLHMPLLYFNDHFRNTKSPDGLAMDILAEPELWSWPDRGPGRNQPMTPIDKNNDAMKALGYYLIDRYGVNVTKPQGMRSRRREYLI